MTPRQLRIVRGAAASVIATLLAAVSHTIGGGQAPNPLLMLAVSVLLTPLAAVLVGRTVRLAGITGAVTITQVLFHLLFAVTGDIPLAGAAPGTHQHGVLTPADLAVVMPSAHTSSLDAPMLVAHLCAAVVTTVLLWRGELILRAITRWVRAVLRRREPVLRTSTPFRATPGDTTTSPLSRILLGGVCRRGPPALSCG
ncbi:hypothetical protein [uncultured Microbacterium sp.]|uniref:hypothetical protein n=1 Tax=uncultured Microbacterium sp. TaxID=191216 RepID=UPI0026086600|nr:hypothetical protein [uncultured Microbacterium sp.]